MSLSCLSQWMASLAMAVVEVALGLAHIGIDRRGVAKEVRLPLAGVAADKAIEVLKPMPVGHCSNGPTWLAWKSGVLWSLPNQAVP